MPDEDEQTHSQALVSKQLAKAVKYTTNVHNLILYSVLLTDELFDAICQLPRLSQIELWDCAMALAERDEPKFVSPVEHLAVSEATYQVAWKLIQMFPKLRWLNFLGDTGAFSLSTLTHTTSNPFANMECVVLRDLLPEDLDMLISLLFSTGERLPLTHFKVTSESRFGLGKDTLFRLISALGNTCLEYLSIEGIEYADVDLFIHVTHHLPHLRACSITYRSTRAEPMRWSSPTWQYAVALKDLAKLTYFSWNLRVDTTYFPDALTTLETGTLRDDLADAYDEFENLPKLFTSYCPSLEYLVITGKARRIERFCRLKPVPVETQENQLDAEIQHRNEYDPGEESGWPLLDPGLELSQRW